MRILEHFDFADLMTQAEKRLYAPLKHHSAQLALRSLNSCIQVPIMFIPSKKVLTMYLGGQPLNHCNAEMNNIQVQTPI